ncbi:MAG TPA: hypothetical protein VHE35_06070 [Kofleriaceae bacterium]|nr:hypothetical protein [Kofleriaceae bacterium]
MELIVHTAEAPAVSSTSAAWPRHHAWDAACAALVVAPLPTLVHALVALAPAAGLAAAVPMALGWYVRRVRQAKDAPDPAVPRAWVHRQRPPARAPSGELDLSGIPLDDAPGARGYVVAMYRWPYR